MRIYDKGIYRDMTPEEEAEIADENSKSEINQELTTDDITEILAEQEYRICLLELGVDENDL